MESITQKSWRHIDVATRWRSCKCRIEDTERSDEPGPHRYEVRRQRLCVTDINMAFARTVKIRSTRGEQVVAACHGGEMVAHLRRMSAGHHFHALAFQIGELLE